MSGRDLAGFVQGQDWCGWLHEVRISTVDRSADWIATEYNNQNDPADFFTFNGAAARLSPTRPA